MKKNILFSIGALGLVTIGVISSTATTEEDFYAQAEANKYSVGYTFDSFENNVLTTKDNNKIRLASSNGKASKNDEGKIVLPKGFKFGNEDKFSGITKFYGVFTGELTFSTSFDKVKSEPGTNTVTEKFLAHDGMILTSGKDYIFNINTAPTFYEFTAQSEVVLESLYVNYSCDEIALPGKYLDKWYLVGNINGIETWEDQSNAKLFDYHIQDKCHIAEHTATYELHKGDAFSLRTFDETPRFLGAERFNDFDGTHDIFGRSNPYLKDIGNNKIEVLKDGLYTFYIKDGQEGWIACEDLNSSYTLKGLNETTTVGGEFVKDTNKENQFNLVDVSLKTGNKISIINKVGFKEYTLYIDVNTPAEQQKYIKVSEDRTSFEVLKDSILDFYIINGDVRITNNEIDALNFEFKIVNSNGESLGELQPHNDNEVKLVDAKVKRGDIIQVIKYKGVLEYPQKVKDNTTAEVSEQITLNTERNKITVQRGGTLTFYIDKNDQGVWIEGTILDKEPMLLLCDNLKIEAILTGEVVGENGKPVEGSQEYKVDSHIIKNTEINISCGNLKVNKWEQGQGKENSAFDHGFAKCSAVESETGAGNATILISGLYSVTIKVYKNNWVDVMLEAKTRSVTFIDVDRSLIPTDGYMAIYTFGDVVEPKFIKITSTSTTFSIDVDAYATGYLFCFFEKDASMSFDSKPKQTTDQTFDINVPVISFPTQIKNF